MSVAGETRRAVDDHPFLRAALRAGVVNYSAAARYLDVGADESAVAAALRRYAAELPSLAATDREAQISMTSGVGEVDAAEEPLLTVGPLAVGPTGDGQTALLVTGEVDAIALATAVAHLEADDASVRAAGVAGDTMVLVVPRATGAAALRSLERALSSVPSIGDGTA